MSEQGHSGHAAQGLDGPEAVLEEYPLSRRQVLTVAAVILVLYVAGVSARWWPTDDSALYLSLGRSLAESGRYDTNGQPCTDLTPGLPLILAGLRVALGPSITAANLTMVLCGLGALLLGYRVVASLAGRHLALATICCVAFSYKYFRHSQLVLTESPAMLLTAGILACYYSRRLPRLVAAGMLTVLSAALITVRAPMVGLLGLMAVGMLLDAPTRKSRAARALASGAIVLATVVTAAGFYYLSTRIANGAPEYVRGVAQGPSGGQVLGRLGAALNGLGLGLPNALAELLTSQDGLAIALTVGLAATVLMIAGMVRQWRRGNRMMPFVVAAYPLMLAAGVGAWAVRARYMAEIHFILVFLVLDGLLVVAGTASRSVARALHRRADRRTAAARPAVTAKGYYRVALAACIFVVAANAPRLARRWYQGAVLSRSGGFYASIDSGRHDGLEEAASALRAEAGPDETIAAPFEARRIVYWIARRNVTPLPDDHETSADARTIADWALRPHQPFRLLILDEGFETQAFRQALLARLRSAGATVTRYGEFSVVRMPAGPEPGDG